MSLDWQATLWSCGFGALALGIALCAAVTMRGARPDVAGARRRERAMPRQSAPASDVDGAGVRSVLAAARRHHAHHRGYRVRAAAVGGAADAVSAHLHPCLRAPAAVAPCDHGACAAAAADPTGDHRGTWVADHVAAAADAGVASRLLLRRRDGLSRRVGKTKAAHRAAHGVLLLPLPRWRSGGRVQRAAGAADLLRCLGISAGTDRRVPGEAHDAGRCTARPDVGCRAAVRPAGPCAADQCHPSRRQPAAACCCCSWRHSATCCQRSRC